MDILARIQEILERSIKLLICVIVTVMVLVVFSNVIGRYFLNSSLAWAEEISRFLLIWSVFLGAVLAYSKDEHLALDIVVQNFSPPMQRMIALFGDILVLFCLILIFNGGLTLTTEGLDWTAPASDIPYGYVYMIVPICSVIMMGQTLLKLYLHWTNHRPSGGISC